MLLPITQYGNPVLRVKCAPADISEEGLATLADNMLETMYAAEGIGLAAPQIGLSMQMIVIDIPEEETETPETALVNGEKKPIRDIMPLCFVNPQIELYGKNCSFNEGCLSVGSIRANVIRPECVKATLTLLDGSVLEIDCGGLLARCLQHETDHLNGVLFTDRVSSAAKITLNKRLKRLAQENGL